MGRPRPACGTYNGYHRHMRRKEEVCNPCREASVQHYHDRRKRSTKSKKNCLHCFRQFEVLTYKGHGKKYCDKVCMIAAMSKTRGKTTCRYCGLEFEPPNVKGVKPRYCSKEHWKLYNERQFYLYQKGNNIRMKCSKKGINPEQLHYIKQVQENRCGICGQEETVKVKSGRGRKDFRVKELSIDHCHITGKFRGLLCSRCNSALGMLKDNVLVAENLVRYLRFHELRLKGSTTYWSGPAIMINVERAFQSLIDNVNPELVARDSSIVKYH